MRDEARRERFEQPLAGQPLARVVAERHRSLGERDPAHLGAREIGGARRCGTRRSAAAITTSWLPAISRRLPSRTQARRRERVDALLVRGDEDVERRARLRLRGERARGAEGELHARARVLGFEAARDRLERLAQAHRRGDEQLLGAGRLREHRDQCESER